jgi:hypothetical protein
MEDFGSKIWKITKIRIKRSNNRHSSSLSPTHIHPAQLPMRWYHSNAVDSIYQQNWKISTNLENFYFPYFCNFPDKFYSPDFIENLPDFIENLPDFWEYASSVIGMFQKHSINSQIVVT